MTFDTSDLIQSSPLLFLTVAGLVLLLLDAFSRVRLIGSEHQKRMPAETGDVITVPLPDSRNYLMPLAVAVTAGGTAANCLAGAPDGDCSSHLPRHAGGRPLWPADERRVHRGSAAWPDGRASLPATAQDGLRRVLPLVLFTVVGMIILIQASDLVTVFLGVETMSLGAYVLTGSWRRSARSSEAAMKYFLVGAFISGVLVYGIALIYGVTETTSLHDIKRIAMSRGTAPLFYIGWMLLVVSFAFKLGVVPFHMWAPDTYEGAPTPVTGFMMSCIKVAGFAGLIRLLQGTLPMLARDPFTGWTFVLSWLAVLSMSVGNLAALKQDNVKRMLAYSSISHAGYLLVGVVALGTVGDAARGPLLFYLASYALTVVAAMGVVSWVGCDERGEERVRLSDWAGLGKREPMAALLMTVSLLSLGGFPPTAGFFGKFYLFQSALGDDKLLWLILVAIANSLVSVYYYLRVITAMYFREPAPHPATTPMQSSAMKVGVLVATLLVLAMGLCPSWLSSLCAAAKF
jgi:NADH-quinone oxidoreductase subunit N